MKKTISSLALLKVNWDHERKDYVDNFIPFLATLMCKKEYKSLDVKNICSDFAEEYGLIIPYHPMITLIDRAKKRGLIRKSYRRYYPILDKAMKYEFSGDTAGIYRKHEQIINKFIEFANNKYNEKLSKDVAEESLIAFLKDHDIDMLFAAKDKTVLPEVVSSLKDKFLINRFVKYIYESDYELFKYIVTIATGQILANALLYDKLDKIGSKLNKVDIYFDSIFIFRLLGLEDEKRKDAYIEFVKSLTEENANLFIFRHSLDEANAILKGSLVWLEDHKFDMSKASPVSRHLVSNNMKASDVDRIIINLERTLGDFNIKVVDTPNFDENKHYQIDEKFLLKVIVDTYKINVPNFNPDEKALMLQRDIRSLSSIYLLRKGKHPHTLKEAKSIFVTTSGQLAYAARLFEKTDNEDRGFIIPVCVTDIFIGTIVWLQSPARVNALNEKKIIADCYAALKPSSILLKRFIREIETLNKEGKINEDECYLLRTHRVAMDLLEEKTMGDPDNFTDRTPEEILEEITEKSKQEHDEALMKEKVKHEETIKQLKEIKEKNTLMENNIINKANHISNMLSNIVFIVLVLFFLLTLLSPHILSDQVKITYPFFTSFLWGLSFILALYSAIFGFNIKDIKNNFKKGLVVRLTNYLSEKE